MKMTNAEKDTYEWALRFDAAPPAARVLAYVIERELSKPEPADPDLLREAIGLINPNRSGGVSGFQLEQAYRLLVKIEEAGRRQGYAKEGGSE